MVGREKGTKPQRNEQLHLNNSLHISLRCFICTKDIMTECLLHLIEVNRMRLCGGGGLLGCVRRPPGPGRDEAPQQGRPPPLRKEQAHTQNRKEACLKKKESGLASAREAMPWASASRSSGCRSSLPAEGHSASRACANSSSLRRFASTYCN